MCIARFFIDKSADEYMLLYYEYGFNFCEKSRNPALAQSETFWKWWKTVFYAAEFGVEQYFVKEEPNISVADARKLFEQVVKVGPAEVYPTEKIQHQITNEVLAFRLKTSK